MERFAINELEKRVKANSMNVEEKQESIDLASMDRKGLLVLAETIKLIQTEAGQQDFPLQNTLVFLMISLNNQRGVGTEQAVIADAMKTSGASVSRILQRLGRGQTNIKQPIDGLAWIYSLPAPLGERNNKVYWKLTSLGMQVACKISESVKKNRGE